jgi:hypothetical protein
MVPDIRILNYIKGLRAQLYLPSQYPMPPVAAEDLARASDAEVVCKVRETYDVLVIVSVTGCVDLAHVYLRHKETGMTVPIKRDDVVNDKNALVDDEEDEDWDDDDE